MYLCDSNVWLSLALSSHVHHGVARSWLDTEAQPASALFCRATQQSLLRLLTTAAVLAPYGNSPLTNRDAWQVYEAFSSDDRIGLAAEEPVGIEQAWVDLAAFALCGGYTLVTTDAAFRQFSDLDLRLLTR